MPEMVKFIDVSKCIGCKACQVACKQWNQRPVGGYDFEHPDLSPNAWTMIRFSEIVKEDKLKWLFRKDGCMHCTDAGCVKVCPSGALHYTSYGTVALSHEKCIGCKECLSACPFHVPRYDAKTDKVYKCDLCFSRLEGALEPACVKVCPTGALSFGEKDSMLKEAYARAEKLGGDANVYGDKFVDGTHVLYVLQYKPDVYESLPLNPSVPLSVTVWKDVLKPLSLLAAGGVLGGAFFHYMIHGPKTPHEDGQEQKGGE